MQDTLTIDRNSQHIKKKPKRNKLKRLKNVETDTTFCNRLSTSKENPLNQLYAEDDLSDSDDSIINQIYHRDIVKNVTTSVNDFEKCPVENKADINKSSNFFKKPNNTFKLQRLSRNTNLGNIISIFRNTDTKTKVEKIIRLRNAGKLFYSKRRQTIVLSSNFSIKYLSPINLQLNPVTEFRFMDWFFPQDSSMFEQFNTKSICPDKNLSVIKRVVQTVKDEVKREYKIHYEDRDPYSINPNKHCNKNEFNYFLAWQESLNNKKALDFKTSLLEFNLRNTIPSSYNEIIETINKNPKAHNNGLSYLYREKKYIKMTDPITQEWINSKPYYTRLNKITGPKNMQQMCKQTLSYSFCDIISHGKGHNSQNVKTILNSSMKIKDIFAFMKNRLDCKKKIREFEGISQPINVSHHFEIVDEYDNIIRGSVLLYDEKYFKQGDLYNKCTIVFLKDNQNYVQN